MEGFEDALKKSGGGSVVLFSSVAVQQGFASHAVISAAKGAVEGMTRAARQVLDQDRYLAGLVGKQN